MFTGAFCAKEEKQMNKLNRSNIFFIVLRIG